MATMSEDGHRAISLAVQFVHVFALPQNPKMFSDIERERLAMPWVKLTNPLGKQQLKLSTHS